MNVLILGNGGREHAIAKKISESPQLTKLYIAPGNPGTALHGSNIPMALSDFEVISEFVFEQEVDLVVVGPEAPLVAGITDFLTSKGVAVVGPSKAGAQLEGSKAFSKKFMQRHDIPTAAYLECSMDSIDQAYAFLENLNPPYVLKADGLAAGKGVLIIDDLDEAKSELKAMLEGKFGKASEMVVVEEFLTGIEFSVFAITDGRDYLILPEAKDYKRIGEGDTGLNTGGMGAVSPVPFVDKNMWQKVEEKIVKPTIQGLHKEQIDYKGFVFFGLINVGGEPYVIEYNCRMGDPETEVVMPRITSDLLPVLSSLESQMLHHHTITQADQVACTVMMVSDGYPGDYKTGAVITLPSDHDSIIYHAGTKMQGDDLVSSGGRVLSITSMGSSIQEALQKSYATISKIGFKGSYHRRDIGQDLV